LRLSDRFTIAFTARASREVATARRWWRANRTKAPDALEEDLRTALDLIANTPGIGAIARNVTLPGVRRLFLNRANYFLYYRPRLPTRSVEIVALWHARRGGEPRL
jgi:plasmid stabilization system protein ParE